MIAIEPEPIPAPVTEYEEPEGTQAAPEPHEPFAAWLLAQNKRGGTLGELAKAAKLDRSFPRAGSADDVRARFNAAGADGEAFEALEDAEREYDRL